MTKPAKSEGRNCAVSGGNWMSADPANPTAAKQPSTGSAAQTRKRASLLMTRPSNDADRGRFNDVAPIASGVPVGRCRLHFAALALRADLEHRRALVREAYRRAPFAERVAPEILAQ